MKRILVPTRSGSDWQLRLAKPKLHWKKGASAMTAAAAWETSAGALPPEIESALETSGEECLRGLSLLMAIPEWEVALEGGETTSNTDVLAVCRNDAGLCIVAVEAKVHEDFGPLVGDKRKAASPGQSQRLQYLQSLLGLSHLDDNIRYQLVHRTASALLTARDFHARTAVMLVQAYDTPRARRVEFESFCSAMRASERGPAVRRADEFDHPALYLVWCDGESKFREVELPSAL